MGAFVQPLKICSLSIQAFACSTEEPRSSRSRSVEESPAYLVAERGAARVRQSAQKKEVALRALLRQCNTTHGHAYAALRTYGGAMSHEEDESDDHLLTPKGRELAKIGENDATLEKRAVRRGEVARLGGEGRGINE